MKYRNTITGVVVNVQSEVKGNWELIPDSLEPAEKAQAEEKKTTPKRKRKTK